MTEYKPLEKQLVILDKLEIYEDETATLCFRAVNGGTAYIKSFDAAYVEANPPVLEALGIKSFAGIESAKGRLLQIAHSNGTVAFLNEVNQTTGKPVWKQASKAQNQSDDFESDLKRLTHKDRVWIQELVKVLANRPGARQ